MTPCWLLVLLCSSPLWQTEGVEGWGISTVPSESECRPYIEKALKEHTPETPQEAVDATGPEHETPPSPATDQEGSIEETEEATTKESTESDVGDESQTQPAGESAETAEESTEDVPNADTETTSGEETGSAEDTTASTEASGSQETPEESIGEDTKAEESSETEEVKEETTDDQQVSEEGEESTEVNDNNQTTSTTEDDKEPAEEQSAETPDEGTTEDKTEEEEDKSTEETQESVEKEDEPLSEAEEQPEETSKEGETGEEVSTEQTQEDNTESEEKVETKEDTATSIEENAASEEEAENTGGEVTDSPEAAESTETPGEEGESAEAGAGEVVTESVEDTTETAEASTEEEEAPASKEETTEEAATSASAEEPSEAPTENTEEASGEETKESVEGAEADSIEETPAEESVEETPAEESVEVGAQTETSSAEEQPVEETPEKVEAESTETIDATPTSEGAIESEPTEETEEQEQPAAEEGEVVKEVAPTVEDQLSLEFEVPKVRRQREHIGEILKLTPESAEVEMLLAKTIDNTLKELKKLYDSAIKPLEILYKYRDLSNRHFGDPEIFSKPLILFMGPWSGGKSSIINYLLDNEFKTSSLRTGAEPSPAYFNILMWGEREEVLDGTQLAADWTFSGLQKFGQGLLDRLRGLKLNNPILEKVNIVEIPGILEIRKQVERLFPFNDACQWFIDRADIIFLVYDPSKLDVGPETEAILDQLKGREYQTRILLNKADQVKPEELMRVQGTLIWNISPLMSSQEPPILYSTSLWSVPYEQGAPTRLLHAQERAFLRDLRNAVDKRVENKIASARRFAVRVRNHAKMVDCYLTTYYNHKTFFGNRKKVADDIIEQPQNYHIYEGLSTLTNISRYDLPDPEVYRDFFRLNPVYDFQRLSDTCTYFRGCPINRLDVAIAYDLPELVGKYKKQAERVLEAAAAQATKS